MESFLKLNIPNQNIFVVDCITSSIVTKPNAKNNCVYISSPNALTELSLALHNTAVFDFVILDSLSTLLFYHKEEMLLKFVNNLRNLARNPISSVA